MKTGMTVDFNGGDTVRVKGWQPSSIVRHKNGNENFFVKVASFLIKSDVSISSN